MLYTIDVINMEMRNKQCIYVTILRKGTINGSLYSSLANLLLPRFKTPAIKHDICDIIIVIVVESFCIECAMPNGMKCANHFHKQS